MGDMIYCVKWEARRVTGLPRTFILRIKIHECTGVESECSLCTRWSHTEPGPVEHISAQSPAGALRRVFTVSRSTARRWVLRGSPCIWWGKTLSWEILTAYTRLRK